MSFSPRRFTSVLVTLFLIGPVLGAALPTAAAEQGDTIMVLAVYHSFDVIPSDGDFLAIGLSAGYRFASIPGVIVSGEDDIVEGLRADADLEQIVYNEPVEWLIETAVVATNADQVWGNVWHANKDIEPMLKGGLPLDGRGVTVGVVDSGANAMHPDLWYAPFALADGVTPAPKIKSCMHTNDILLTGELVESPNCDEATGHGTHVAGIVAGSGMMADMGFTATGAGEYNGAAPGAQLVVAGLGVETVALGGLVLGALAGLDYMYRTADQHGIRVVTNSWSSTAYNCNYAPGNWNQDSNVHHAITNKLVQDKGITVLWASNNAGGTKPLGTSPQSRNTMPGVINVANYNDGGSGTRDGDITASSGDGCVKSGGSAQDLVWTWPDVAAPGTNIVSTASGPDGVFGQTPIFVGASPNDAPFYTTLTGTSMATPHVAGVAALLYQAYPAITPAQVERILIETSTPFADNVATRNVTGSATYWGPKSVNNAVAGFADKTQCVITPAIAARAEANDATLDALYPGFRDFVQPRTVNGKVVDADASLYVCRDFKRGHGLVDAKAAVLRALELSGEDTEEGLPEIKITAPDAGETITETLLTVEGLVDREGEGPNAPPTATLAASTTNGPSPLAVDFSLAAQDADGTIAAFSLDFGDASASVTGTTLPTGVVSHTYTADGDYTATLTVTDDEGAMGTSTLSVSVGGLPETNENVEGGIFAYNYVTEVPGVITVGPGVSNIIALGTGVVLDDSVPKYPAGTSMTLQARSVASTDPNVPLSLSSTGSVRIFDDEGALVYGPTATPAFDDSDALGNFAIGFDGPAVPVPLDWSGRYHIAWSIDTANGPVYITDSTSRSHKPIDVLNAGGSGPSPGGDEGHSIADPDDDGTTPMGELQWVDVSTDADSVSFVIRVGMVPPQAEGASPTLYALFINGIEFESYLYGVGFGGARVYDATNGVQVMEATSRWDATQNLVLVDIPRAYISTVTDDCPCLGHVEAQAGPPFFNSQPTLDRAPNAGEKSLAASWQSLGTTVPLGSSSDPENSDETGDAALPHADVTKIWVSRESATELDITVAVADLASAPPSVDAGAAKAATTYGSEFCVNNAAQTYTAASGDFAGLSGVVCYRLSATNGVLGVQHSGGVIQKDGTGSCGLAGITKGVTFNTAANTLTWTVDLLALDVDTIGAGLQACNTTPVTRNARDLAAGDVVSRFSAKAGVTAGAVVTGTFNMDSISASASRAYTLGATAALVADAGPALTGGIGDAIPIAGSATGGTAPYTCAWSGEGASFGSASACDTTVSFATSGSYAITLTVTDAVGATATDLTAVTILSDAIEHVQVVIGGRTATAAVTTSTASPTAPFSVDIDLAGLPGGPTDIVATWFDADGTTVLATTTRTIVLQTEALEAFVEILTPAEDSEVSGVSAVTGNAGHRSASGGAPAATSGLNHYGLPVWSGMNGGRASIVLEGEILLPCNLCQPTTLEKPVEQMPNAAWNPVRNNVQPLVSNRLGTSVTWLNDPAAPTNGVDGYWFDINGRGGDAFVLSEAYGVEVDIRFFGDWVDPSTAQLGAVNGPNMPKSGTIPDAANWAFVYARRGTEETVANQWLVVPVLTVTPTIVPPAAVQALAATPGAGTVSLAWSAPIADGGELLGYKIQRDGVTIATKAAAGYLDTPGDTVPHVYTVLAYNSAGDGAPSAVTATAGSPVVTPVITTPLDGAVGVAPTTTIAGSYTPGTRGGGGGGTGAFANTHYVALFNLNDPSCGGDLGYGDHVIFEKLTDHAVDVLGVPANNIHVYHEQGTAPVSGTDSSNFAKLGPDWKDGSAIDGPARWSLFQNDLRDIAETAAASEAAGGAPARIFFLESSHGLQASVVLGDGATDSLFCLVDADVSSTMLGTLLNDIDADVAAAHSGVAIEWSINIDCSFCGGFVDRPLPAPGQENAYSAGVVGPNRVVEVGCTWVTECFGNPAITYDYMFNHCTYTGKADGYGPAVPVEGAEFALSNPLYSEPDGVITLEEAYWCGLETSRTDPFPEGPLGGNGPWAPQQMFQVNDQLPVDMFQLDGFPLWEVDSSLDLGTQDPDAPLSLATLALPDVRATDPAGDARTPFTDLLAIEASATATSVLTELTVEDLTISSLEAEDVVEYRLTINGDEFGACYSLGSVLVYGYDIPAGDDPATGEPTYGAVSEGTAVYDAANGIVSFSIPLFELTDATLPAEVVGSSHAGECSSIMPVADDVTPAVMTSEDDDEDPVGSDKITVVLEGPTPVTGDATLDSTGGTWSFDPLGDLASGVYTATATQFHDDGDGFAAVGVPATVQFTVGIAEDVQAPTAPGAPTLVSATTSSIALSWTASTDNVGVDHYEILRDGASVGTSVGTSFTDTGLAAATPYTYAITAYDAAGNSATGDASELTTSHVDPILGSVTLHANGFELGTATIDLSAGSPASWSINVDWNALSEGVTTLTADYADGEGGSATDTLQVVVTDGVGIVIETPSAGANVLPTFTVSGTVDGAGGPDGIDTSTYMMPDGTADERHPAYMLSTTTNVLTSLDAALNGESGYVGVAADPDGARIVRAYFTGAAPAAPNVAMPTGWALEMVSDVELQRAMKVFKGTLPTSRIREGPPAPDQTVGIGPGSHLLMEMDYASGYTFACTANFVWKDQNGDYYLGAAGHCFLPNPISGGPQRSAVATHGPNADYDRTETTVRVCIANCEYGGQLGFFFEGTTVELGHPAYARQTGSGGDVGNDFGIVKIPESLYDLVHPEMPVWNGPVSEGTLGAGEPAVLYGNAAGFGETWPTMARAGFGTTANANSWSAVLPSFQGDSGSALVSAAPRAGDRVIEGVEAIGTLTHLAIPGPVVGTTMAKSKILAAQADITIVPVFQGEDISVPDPTVPDAPTLNTLTPGPAKMGLAWSAPANDGRSDITGYTVKYGTVPGTYSGTQTFSAVTSGEVTGLAPATQYHFVVTATNGVGTSANSNELAAMTQAVITPPSAPQDLIAIAQNGGAALAWDAPENDGGAAVTSYVVQYTSTGGGSGTATTPGHVREVTITGLTNGIEYTFKVAATNSAGTGTQSAPAVATPNGPPPPGFAVQVRADADGVEVLPWTPADSFDGSNFAIELADIPGGELTVTARLLQDGVEVAAYDVDVHVLSAPVLNVPATLTGTEKQAVTFTAAATDADGPNGLSFSLVDAPPGATIGGLSGEFSWTPDYGAAELDFLTVRVTDAEGLFDEEQVALDLAPANRPPILTGVGNRAVGEGQPLTITLEATDHESDALTYSATPLPAGATFNTATGVFEWTPAFGLEGNHPVTFGVTDGFNSDSESVIITVGNVNRPPVLDPIGAKALNETELLAFLTSASDPDGEAVTVSASGLPAGATFVAGVFSWTPSYTAAGTYNVTFTATDGSLTDSEIVTITVANLDRAPTLNPVASGSVVQLNTLSLTLKATDPDGDAITWSVNPAHPGIVIQDLGGGNAKLLYTPPLDHLGPQTFTVFATSGELSASRATVLTALFRAGMTVDLLTTTSKQASPNEVVKLRTLFTNTGPHTDTFQITASNEANWLMSGVPAPVTLASGASVIVELNVVVNASSAAISWTSITARSLGDGTTAKTARYRIDIPVFVTLRVENITLTDLADGVVLVKHLDGSVAPGAQVSVTQTPDLLGALLRSTIEGTADADGAFEFDFTRKPGGLLPGRHDLLITARKPGGFDTVYRDSYTIGP